MIAIRLAAFGLALSFADAASGANTVCLGERAHTISYDIQGETLETMTSAKVSLRPAPLMHSQCSDVDKHFCVGANVDHSSCAHAAKPIPFNDWIECRDCFAALSGDFQYDCELSGLLLKSMQLGVSNIHILGSLELGSSANAQRSTSGKVTLSDYKTHFSFTAGILPIDITIGLPATLDYTLGVSGSYDASVGAALDISLGDHFVAWDDDKGFYATNTPASVSLNPSPPTFSSNAHGSINLHMDAGLSVEVGGMVDYNLHTSHNLPTNVDANADYNSKASGSVCANADYNLVVSHDARVHTVVFGQTIDKMKTDQIYSYQKSGVVHACTGADEGAVV